MRLRAPSRAFRLHWGAATPRERGPVIGTVSRPADRNVIGAHGGSYALYRALAVSSGALNPIRTRRSHQYPIRPIAIGPLHAMDRTPDRIVSLDPWGHRGRRGFPGRDRRAASTSAPRIADHARRGSTLHEMREAVARGPALAATARSCTHGGERVGDQGRHRPGVVPARHRRAFRHDGDEPAPHPVRADGRHVPGARDAARPAGLPAA